ncbi:MAG: TetR/AcrR family transcriptional regulator [Oscillospiraceae bacterium]|nr:TetR/AcrR family transcriptional regulator [Oscillospiraceae bacterium]MCI9289980.1 TetR/AcrR family transcriptional regulator [Oscillospiraceae bacterium]
MPPSSRFSAARTASRPSTAPVNTAALLELLEGRELRDISVSQIATAAGVHRVSFYRSFAEKEDILREHINVTFREWESSRTPPAQDQAMPDLFAYMARNGGFYRLLYRRGLFHLFKAVLLSNIGPKPEYSNHIAYAAAFLANGIYGWIEEWIARGMQESPEEMAVLLQEKL